MKRDMDVVRDLICQISEAAGKPSSNALVADKSQNEAAIILYHLDLLNRAGFVTGKPLALHGFKIWEHLDLTWAGHDFLDSVRDPTVWGIAKDRVKAAGGFTLEILAGVAKEIISQNLIRLAGGTHVG